MCRFALIALVAITSPLLVESSARSLLQVTSQHIDTDSPGTNATEVPGSGPEKLIQIESDDLETDSPGVNTTEVGGEDAAPESTSINDETDLGVMVKTMMQEIDAATGQSASNGTSAAMKTTVDSMMVKFETMAKDKFIRAFANTQKELAKAAGGLSAQNQKVVAGLGVANANHEKLGACRVEEQALLQAHEVAFADGAWANKTADKACQEKQDAQIHDWNIAKELTDKHKCDLGEAACPKLEALKKHLDEQYAKAKTMRDEYKAKSEACENTRKASETQETLVQKKFNVFSSKKASCDHMEFESQKSMCMFGNALQQKCDQYKTVTDLIVKIRDGKDTSYSEADRQANWVKAVTLKCQLGSYTGNGGVDDSVKKLCESDVNYEKDIGVMDYQSAIVNGVVHPSPPNFTCSETSILFNGKKWATGNESALYKSEDQYKPDVALTPVGVGPFSFCQSDSTRANCRGFTCDEPLKPKANPETIKCILTECSVYECCAGGAAPAAAAAKPE